tara:strand:+ start:404 stop:514 length:111 start_codon:yes stop_codon:yes gene_type:complete
MTWVFLKADMLIEWGGEVKPFYTREVSYGNNEDPRY